MFSLIMRVSELMKISNSQTDRLGISICSTLFTQYGFVFREQPIVDLGVDAHLELVKEGRGTGKLVGLQIKSGPSYFKEDKEDCFIFRFDETHRNYWLNHSLPIVICLCDVDKSHVYWQLINEENVDSTGKDYKIRVPKNQILDSSYKLVEDVFPINVPQSKYTCVKTNDVSHVGAKRYSYRVILNEPLSKIEIASVIREVTLKSIDNEDYYRNERVKSTWKGRSSQVVCVFVYANLFNEKQDIYTCRSQWIDGSLQKNMQPTKWKGQNIGYDIHMDWNEDWEEVSLLISNSQLSKGQYMDQLNLIIREMDDLIIKIEDRQNFINLIESFEQVSSRALYLEGAPVECSELDDAAQGVFAYFDQYIIYSKQKNSMMANKAIKAFHENRKYLDYEYKKMN